MSEANINDVLRKALSRNRVTTVEQSTTLSDEEKASFREFVARGQKNTERMLKALLGALGFEHVEAVFAEPPKT